MHREAIYIVENENAVNAKEEKKKVFCKCFYIDYLNMCIKDFYL